MKNRALEAVISAAVFTAALYGGTDSPIPLSEKAMAHLRAPSGSMPDEFRREISEVLRRHFGGALAAVMGGEADSRYDAVTTLAAMFGERDSLVNRLDISSNMKIPSGGAYPAVISLYISFYTNDKLSGRFKTAVENVRKEIKVAVDHEERSRLAAQRNNRPIQSRVLRLGAHIALREQGGWAWWTDDGQMRIYVRTLTDGLDPNLVRGKAEALHAQLEGAGLYGFLRRLSAGGTAVPAVIAPPVQEPADCGKGAALTRYLDALRAHRRNAQTIDGELEWLLNDRRPETLKIIEYGRKAERIAADYHKTFKEFQLAETRRGLIEELDLLVETTLLLNQVAVKYQHLAQVPITLIKPEDIVRSRNERSSTIIKLVRDCVASGLESEGLRDILTSESWEEAVQTAAGHAQRKVEEFIDGETEKIFGFGFHDVESAKRALQLQLRREIRRQVAKLLIKVTSNQIVIEIVAGPVIRWIERDLLPRLKEALRERGNLPERVARSIKTMEAARLELNKLPCNAKLRDVRRRVASTWGTIHAARFLNKDLIAGGAGAADEFASFDRALSDLGKTIRWTEVRFLLTKNDYEDDLVLIDEVLGIIRGILKRSIPSETRNPIEPQPRPPVRMEEAAAFSSISPALKSLRFYEGDVEGFGAGFRDYRAAFSRAESRLIWWELNFDYPDPGRRIDFSVEAVYYLPDGREMGRNTTAFHFQPGWTSSQHTNGYGYRDRGGWQPGIYRVVLFVDGARIAEGRFSIIE
jgi:hypothetical protein